MEIKFVIPPQHVRHPARTQQNCLRPYIPGNCRVSFYEIRNDGIPIVPFYNGLPTMPNNAGITSGDRMTGITLAVHIHACLNKAAIVLYFQDLLVKQPLTACLSMFRLLNFQSANPQQTLSAVPPVHAVPPNKASHIYHFPR